MPSAATLPESSIVKLLSAAKELLCVAILCCSMLLTQAALGQVLFPLERISESFGVKGDLGQTSWFAAAYSLTVGTLVLPSGRMGDLFGHKLLLVIGFSWFSLWSMVAGLSSYSGSAIFFDVCRGLQGVGPAILLPNGIAILGRMYPPGSVKKYLSFSAFAATAPNGALLGAVFSVLFSQNPSLGWPWAFYMLAIVCALLALLSILVVPNATEVDAERPESGSDAETEATATPVGDAPSVMVDDDDATMLDRLDLWPAVVVVTGMILFNYAFNQALVSGWQKAYVWALLLVGFLMISAFFWMEARSRYPLIPTSVFTLRGSLILACIGLGWSSFGIWIFYCVRFLQNIRSVSPLLSVAQFAPCGVTGLTAAFASSEILRRAGPATVMALAMSAFCVGSILIATMPVQQTYWAQAFVSIAVMPFGMDMSFPAGSIIISDLLPHHQQGTAGSLVNTVVNYSIALGLGFAGTVEQQVNDHGSNSLSGIRGATYIGIGFSGLGVALAIANLVVERRQARGGRLEDKEKGGFKL
ncbi:MFS general substrate transporter [Violaceomyces palustris]|uniref:MFS general substrate transporter n=1 Tax=Violaceomyces palustris TaxID=1673888 RepID=A0ACD0P4P0_9BASI|nr:MFS general substrate transporter [Violaceomyces palustris]